jgi:hypothetical protein
MRFERGGISGRRWSGLSEGGHAATYTGESEPHAVSVAIDQSWSTIAIAFRTPTLRRGRQWPRCWGTSQMGVYSLTSTKMSLADWPSTQWFRIVALHTDSCLGRALVGRQLLTENLTVP